MAEAAVMEKDAEVAADGADGEATTKKKGRKKLLLLIGLPLILLGGGGGGAFMAGLLDPLLGVEEAAVEGEEAKAETHKAFQYYDLPDMLVNLNTSSKQGAFLKIQVALELDAETDIPALEATMPRVIDSFQVYLRELRPEDLRGSEGLYRLKEELLLRVNQAVAPIAVHDVLFKSVLAQ
jgi:flagellar FliL protein